MADTSDDRQDTALDEFVLKIRRSGESTVFELQGELCLLTVPRVSERLTEALSQGCARLLFDLRAVDFMDSTGVRLLLEADERSRERSIQFAIVLGENQPKRVLELAGLKDRPPRVAAEDLPGD